MKSILVNKIFSSLSSKLPSFDNMDAYVDYILPYIKANSKDLSEKEVYTNKRWKEFRDDEDFQEEILFIFKDDGTLLISVDGNVGTGQWEALDRNNTLLIESGGKSGKKELYELTFLSKEFMILRKHGNQKRLGKSQYLVLALEKSNKKYEWDELMEKLYAAERQSWLFYVLLAALLLIVLIAVALS